MSSFKLRLQRGNKFKRIHLFRGLTSTFRCFKSLQFLLHLICLLRIDPSPAVRSPVSSTMKRDRCKSRAYLAGVGTQQEQREQRVLHRFSQGNHRGDETAAGVCALNFSFLGGSKLTARCEQEQFP